MNEAVTEGNVGNVDNVKLVYIFYLVGIFFGPLGIVGVIMAYVHKNDAPEWLQSHYQFQIRTFWIGAIYIISGAILALVIIGWFIILFWFVWLAVRSIKGMKYLDQKQAHPNPTGWMFG